MKTVRLLIVTHSPLSAKFGAGQMAINLADAFRNQGHNVTVWSPYPMPSLQGFWHHIKTLLLMRSRLNSFLSEQETFDIIDCPGVLITNKVVTKSKLVVARSVQPDISYMVLELLNVKGIKSIMYFPFNVCSVLVHSILLVQGWFRATFILCLGSLELKIMKKWFPFWRSKLLFYVNAISNDEQLKLTEIRLKRLKSKSKEEGTKFIWIGRWVAHKGVEELVKFVLKRLSSNPKDSFTIAGCGQVNNTDFPPELIKSGKLRIIPSFERNELYSLLANHDVGLFTSKVEGWGLVLNEMLESGLPVFATQAGAVPDLRPFCKHLYSFPPPDFFVFNNFDGCRISDDYYKYFNWDKIAQDYATKIFVKLNSVK